MDASMFKYESITCVQSETYFSQIFKWIEVNKTNNKSLGRLVLFCVPHVNAWTDENREGSGVD